MIFLDFFLLNMEIKPRFNDFQYIFYLVMSSNLRIRCLVVDWLSELTVTSNLTWYTSAGWVNLLWPLTWPGIHWLVEWTCCDPDMIWYTLDGWVNLLWPLTWPGIHWLVAWTYCDLWHDLVYIDCCYIIGLPVRKGPTNMFF